MLASLAREPRLMPEIAADPPSPSCYRLFSGSGIQEFQRFGPDLFCFARTRYAVGAVLPLSALTDKDRGDLEFGLAMGADWVALPFTTSGYTSLPAARERAAAPIPSLSADPVVARRMALVWASIRS
jgi:hypothetical protein